MNLLWIPHTGWHIPQRSKLFARALAQRHTVHVTNWVADFSQPQDYLSWRYLKNYLPRSWRDGQIVVHHIPRVSPALFSRHLRQLNRLIYSQMIANIVRRYQIEAVVGTYVAPPPQGTRLLFDLYDDNPAFWRATGLVPTFADEIEATEADYMQQADVIVSASYPLLAKATRIAPQKRRVRIPNGVDVAAMQTTDGRQVRQQLGIAGEQVVGIIGNLSKRSEAQMLLNVIARLQQPGLVFLVVGGGSERPFFESELTRRQFRNVRCVNQVPETAVFAYFKAIDIGLCPYGKTAADEARSPLRLVNYSAAGKPVVCTDLDEVRQMDFPNVVRVNSTAADIVYGICQALPMPQVVPDVVWEYDIHRLAAQYERELIA